MSSQTLKSESEISTSKRENLLKLALGALGVVYGDIGTSPLYAIKECFNKSYALSLTQENVFGVLSLVLWTLVFIVAVEYLTFVMRADNRGEGGIMALIALITPEDNNGKRSKAIFYLIILGLFGTSLLWADGIITPAISVLSAIEGLEVATPVFKPFVVPGTLAVLIILFLFQKRGTASIGSVFGPVMLCWFFVIGILGIRWILKQPQILKAVNPYYAINFFMSNGWRGFFVLGGVVLCVTGTEALYADMGHFGKTPIKFGWYCIVFPGLLLNYFGQGAVILSLGEKAIENPFYLLVEGWQLYPLVLLATIATIIASQALISGAFSLAQQAIQLGYFPRLNIVHTSYKIHGQIYIPEINYILMIACLSLVITFKTSTNLAAAYGIAVMGTMTITAFLLYAVAIKIWKWGKWVAVLFTLLLLSILFPLLFANITKIFHGGWVPLFIGIITFSIITTWKRGRYELTKSIIMRYLPTDIFLESISESSHQIARVEGTAVFMTSDPAGVSPTLLHHLKHNKVLHEQVILLTVRTERIPMVPDAEKIEIHRLPLGFHQVIAHYGFMEKPDIHRIMEMCSSKGLAVSAESISYYLGRETLITTGKTKMARWRKILFAFLSRNARTPTAFFNIPPNRVVELGMQIQF